MSGDEKEQQIGRVVTQYQAAKVDLAHLNEKIKRMAEIYSWVGRALSEQGTVGDFRIEDGHLRFLYFHSHSGNQQDIGSHLLNEADLVAILTERTKAIKRVEELKAQLNSLGITNLG